MRSSVAAVAVAVASLVSCASAPELTEGDVANEIGRALFEACPGVTVSAGKDGTLLATSGDVQVTAATRTACLWHDGGADVTFELGTYDAHHDVIGALSRKETFDVDCAAARRAIHARSDTRLLRAAPLLCTEGFLRPAPIVVDLQMLLEPAFSQLGPLTQTVTTTPPEPSMLTWTVNDRSFTLSGSAQCESGSPDLESAGNNGLRLYFLKVSLDLKEGNTKLRSWRQSVQLLGIDCDHALQDPKKSVAKFAAQTFEQAKASLR